MYPLPQLQNNEVAALAPIALLIAIVWLIESAPFVAANS
jgi:hypothetical protein